MSLPWLLNELLLSRNKLKQGLVVFNYNIYVYVYTCICMYTYMIYMVYIYDIYIYISVNIQKSQNRKKILKKTWKKNSSQAQLFQFIQIFNLSLQGPGNLLIVSQNTFIMFVSLKRKFISRRKNNCLVKRDVDWHWHF